MILSRRRHEPTEGELVAYADGTLPAMHRARIEAAIASSPRLRASVDAQRRAKSLLDTAAAERAPAALRARLALIRPIDREPASRRIGFLVSSAAVATIVAIAALVLGGGEATSPTVIQASLLTSRAPQHPVQAPRSDRGALPGVRAAGLTYPYWEDRFGYRSTGVRYDRLRGRRATIVYYSKGPTRVAYEIVSGPPLRLGAAAATSTRRQGVVLRTLRTRRGPVVTWTRRGHTCVLTGTGTPVAVLLDLGSWRRGGRIPY
ncbi:MAG: hypothetical protein ACJ764_14715 [Solirubrobacteraceae bacterium]